MCEFSFFEELNSLETNNASRWQIKQCGLLDEQQLVIILQDASSFHQAQRYNDGFGTALIRPGLLSRGTRLRGQHVEVTLKNIRSHTINPTDFSFKVIQGNNLFQALDSKNSNIFCPSSVCSLGTTVTNLKHRFFLEVMPWNDSFVPSEESYSLCSL